MGALSTIISVVLNAHQNSNCFIFLSLRRLITVLDEADDCLVVCKLQDFNRWVSLQSLVHREKSSGNSTHPSGELSQCWRQKAYSELGEWRISIILSLCDPVCCSAMFRKIWCALLCSLRYIVGMLYNKGANPETTRRFELYNIHKTNKTISKKMDYFYVGILSIVMPATRSHAVGFTSKSEEKRPKCSLGELMCTHYCN